MNSIAIECEYGSGGSDVGQLVASKLNMPFYDCRALIEAARNFRFPMTLLENYELDESNNVLKCLALIAKQSNGENISKIEEVFSAIQKTIIELDKQRPSVFVGCSASRALAGKNVKSIFICASDMKDRIKRVVEKKSVPIEQAASIICKEDAYRETYFTLCAKESWHDCSCYDMTLNTSMIPTTLCAEIVVKEMRKNKAEEIGTTFEG